MGFSLAFVVAAAVFGGEHHKVTDLINFFWCTVFVGMVCLLDFCCKEVVLSLLDVECNTGHNFVGRGLFSGGIRTTLSDFQPIYMDQLMVALSCFQWSS